jgi:hypothetical protein
MTSSAHFLLTGLLATLAVAGPATAQSPAPNASAGGDPAALAEAVSFAPLGASAILFTDWAAMRAFHGIDGVTSGSPLDERMDAFMTLSTEEGPFAGFGIARLARHAEAWGWDTTDVDWEAAYWTDGPPVAVVRLRDDIDLDPIVAHYDDRGFSVDSYDDATIRSHEMDVRADWITSSDFGVLNTAFLDDGRTLVLSSSVDGVKAALDARHVQSFRAAPASLVAGALGAPLSAAIDVGIGSCAAYDPRLAEDPDGPNAAVLDQAGLLRDWEAMGVGTSRTADGEPAGRFAFAYGDARDAMADLAGRALLAQQGYSLMTQRPLAERILTLDAFDVDGNVLTLEVTPAEGGGRRLQQAFLVRDLAFATCSSSPGLS